MDLDTTTRGFTAIPLESSNRAHLAEHLRMLLAAVLKLPFYKTYQGIKIL
jgi:hypothetical protein